MIHFKSVPPKDSIDASICYVLLYPTTKGWLLSQHFFILQKSNFGGEKV